MAKFFQPCPLCGNCGMYRRSERDGNDVMLRPTRCAVNAKPIYDEGFEMWLCEEKTKKKSGRKKVRKNKPWQDRVRS